jgi:hypothetical protein
LASCLHGHQLPAIAWIHACPSAIFFTGEYCLTAQSIGIFSSVP